MIYNKYRSTIFNKNQLAQNITKRNMHRANHIYQRTTSLLPYTTKFTKDAVKALYTHNKRNKMILRLKLKKILVEQLHIQCHDNI